MLPDNILFSSDPANDLQTFLSKKNYSRLAVLTDENTLAHCYPKVRAGLGEHFTITVKSGEEAKNLDTCVQIWQAMTDRALDRHACLVVLGGGVLGDMGGFCAATYKRGIDFILVPTTLLAQADASIGGKLGIDFNHYKNHIGVFSQPTLTMLHCGFLKTLPLSELRSGFAEVIKHTLIADRAMWDKIIQRSLVDQDWDALIKHSVEFKAFVTQTDPREKGLRKILNAGHTIGHALETHLLATGKRILHGEAIAVGLLAEGYIGLKRGFITEKDFGAMCAFILKIYGKVNVANDSLDAVAALTLQDKKNKGNSVLSVLPDGIGNAKWDCEISLEEVKDALTFYRSLQM